MIEKPGTWGQVMEGTTILTPTELPIVIVRTAETTTGRWYLAHDHQRREIRISPKPSDLAVTILEATPEEAELLAKEILGAERLVEAERDARMEERAKRWVVPPFPAKGRGALEKAKDHLNFYHGTYTTDIRTLKQAAAAHAEMHDPEAVGGVFMDLPHTHRKGD